MQLDVNLVNNELLLTLTPHEKGELLSENKLKEFLVWNAFDYLNFYFFENNIDKIFLTPLESSTTIKIAEKKDALIEIKTKDDKEAYVTFYPDYGGKSLAKDDIKNFLKADEIVHGIIEEVIDAIENKKELENILIAKASDPIDGEDAKFEPLVVIEEKGPKLLEDGRVDFHNMGIITKVEPGNSLMRKIPATKGYNGKSIRGKEIPAKPGTDKPWGSGKNAIISAIDPDILVALTGGQPIIKSNFVNIEPILTLESVGVETGDINFAGTIIINNGVKDDFSVRATANIIINGLVEAADLNAEENIEINGGIVGHPENKANIKAGGNITAKFVQNAVLEAKGKIFIQDTLIHSDTTALEAIEIKNGKGRGQIVGGTTRATSYILAKVLGSPASPATVIEVGFNPFILTFLNELRHELEENKRKLNEIIKNIIFAKTHHENKPIIKELEGLREKLLFQINELKEQENMWMERMSSSFIKSHVQVFDKIYAGVSVQIGNVYKQFEETTMGAIFYVKDDRLAVK